jgi:hypothetical protein
MDRDEGGAPAEGESPDFGDALGQLDRDEATAGVESGVLELGDTLGKGDRGETGATFKSTLPDLRHTLGNVGRHKTGAVAEGVFLNPVHMHTFTGRDLNRKEITLVESWRKVALVVDDEVRRPTISTCTRHSWYRSS